MGNPGLLALSEKNDKQSLIAGTLVLGQQAAVSKQQAAVAQTADLGN